MAWALEEALPYLAAKDARMAAAIEEMDGVTRQMEPGLFSCLALAIVQQQISLKAADTVWRRFQETLGNITPAALLAADMAELRACGISQRKAEYLRGAAEAFDSGRMTEEALSTLPDEEVITRLTTLRGVGRWTAEMLLIFSLGRQDVMAYDDLGLRNGLCRLYHHQDMPRERFARYARRFHPYGTAASLVLWEVSAGRAPAACALPIRGTHQTTVGEARSIPPAEENAARG